MMKVPRTFIRLLLETALKGLTTAIYWPPASAQMS